MSTLLKSSKVASSFRELSVVGSTGSSRDRTLLKSSKVASSFRELSVVGSTGSSRDRTLLKSTTTKALSQPRAACNLLMIFQPPTSTLSAHWTDPLGAYRLYIVIVGRQLSITLYRLRSTLAQYLFRR